MEVPGSVGWSISGDKTYEFARTPLEFIQSRISKYNSNVFSVRVLNKGHIFITSNHGVKEMLIGEILFYICTFFILFHNFAGVIFCNSFKREHRKFLYKLGGYKIFAYLSYCHLI